MGKAISVVSIDSDVQRDLEQLQREFLRLEPQARRELSREVFTQIEQPLVAKIRFSARTPAERKVAPTVKAFKSGANPSIWLGRGSGAAADMALGTEFGGRSRNKTTYARRKKGGGYSTVRRRTTMQFREHLGRTGYWMAPLMRAEAPATERKVTEIMQRLILQTLTGSEAA